MLLLSNLSHLLQDESLGNDLLRITTELAKKLFNSRLLSCYALGSLAHGGFSKLVSDVDMAIIINDPIKIDDADIIDSIKKSIKNSGAPLADRLSIFWGSLDSLNQNNQFGRFPALDKLDLINNGKLLTGKEIRYSLSRPTKSELVITGAKFSLQLLNTSEINMQITHPRLLYQKGVRHITKTILFPVRLLYTSFTGNIGHNEEAVKYLLENTEDINISNLTEAAFNWRYHEPENEDQVIQLTDKILVNLYKQFIDNYHTKMLEYNETNLATDLINWKVNLTEIT